MKNKEFANKNTKKNTWENHKIDIEIKIKNQFPNTIFFFKFFNTLKTNEDRSFEPKTLFKNLGINTREVGIFAL